MKLLNTFWKSICVCLLVAVTQTLVAQQVVTGRITNASDGTPVVDASVFVANTSVGTVSDASGNYSFIVQGRGSFEIVVSHVGYRSAFHKIVMPQDAHQYNVALEIVELEEITVSTSGNYRRSDVNLFWSMILGESPSRRGMEVLNAEKVYYYLNIDSVLKVSCREPVEIINHHTGYRIRYVLQSFEHNYRTGETVFGGSTSFEELVPSNSREKRRWEQERQKVYAVSLNRFFRSLYRGNIHKEGFLLTKGIKEPVNIKDFSQADSGVIVVNIEVPLLLTYYGKPITDQMIKDVRKISGGYKTLIEFKPQQIRVFPNGTYENLLSTVTVGKYIGGLSSRVPIDYPENTQNIED